MNDYFPKLFCVPKAERYFIDIITLILICNWKSSLVRLRSIHMK